jgi:hypothetical protein
MSFEFHRSHRKRSSAGYHLLNLLVSLALLIESAPRQPPHRSLRW